MTLKPFMSPVSLSPSNRPFHGKRMTHDSWPNEQVALSYTRKLFERFGRFIYDIFVPPDPILSGYAALWREQCVCSLYLYLLAMAARHNIGYLKYYP